MDYLYMRLIRDYKFTVQYERHIELFEIHKTARNVMIFVKRPSFSHVLFREVQLKSTGKLSRLDSRVHSKGYNVKHLESYTSMSDRIINVAFYNDVTDRDRGKVGII